MTETASKPAESVRKEQKQKKKKRQLPVSVARSAVKRTAASSRVGNANKIAARASGAPEDGSDADDDDCQNPCHPAASGPSGSESAARAEAAAPAVAPGPG